MNREEFRPLLLRVTAIEPAYRGWIEKMAHSIGSSIEEAYESMVADWFRAVEQYESSEVAEVLNEIASTRRELPSYSKLWRTIAGCACDNRMAAKLAERSSRDREVRVHCLNCMDAGHVLIYYPPFLEWIRPRFEQWQHGGFPARWYEDARSEWYGRARRNEVKATAELSLVCCCNSPQSVLYRGQLDRFRDYMRSPEGKPMRAAYVGQWNPDRHCRVRFSPQEDLAEWYAAHRPNESYEWNPSQFDYAGGEF